MESVVKDFLIIGLKSNGFTLDFEAKADLYGGFECYLFSNGKYVAIITAKNVYSEKRRGETKLVYKYYYCQMGDDEYLERFLELEGITKNPCLLAGEYGGLIIRLINKVKGYGRKNVALLIRPLNNDELIGEIGDACVVHQFPKGEALHALSI